MDFKIFFPNLKLIKKKNKTFNQIWLCSISFITNGARELLFTGVDFSMSDQISVSSEIQPTNRTQEWFLLGMDSCMLYQMARLAKVILPQMLHGICFSPVWILKWAAKWNEVVGKCISPHFINCIHRIVHILIIIKYQAFPLSLKTIFCSAQVEENEQANKQTTTYDTRKFIACNDSSVWEHEMYVWQRKCYYQKLL